MKLICGIERFAFGRKSTGSLFLIESKPEAVSIEDERRRVKVAGETCIPPRTYPLDLRTEGQMHLDYLERFGESFHKGMIWLRDVPGFEWVYLHCGNKEIHSRGCPLINTSLVMTPDYEFEGRDSEKAYRRIYPRIADAILGDGAELVVYERHAA